MDREVVPVIRVRSPAEDIEAKPVYVTGPNTPGVTWVKLVSRDDYPDAMVIYLVAESVPGAIPVFLGFPGA